MGSAYTPVVRTPPLAFALLGASLFAGCDSAPADTDAGDAVCAPTCRSGFVCIAGDCVSACNPACGPGETCTSEGECLEGGMDGGPSPDDAGAAADAGASSDGAAGDAALDMDAGRADGGAPTSCPDEEVLCGGACVAPTLPDVGPRTPTSGRWGNDWMEGGDIAVDPCTGNVGLAWSQQVSGGDNWEVYVAVVPAALGASATTPVRVSTAPGAAAAVALSWAGDRFGVFWSDPRHDPAPETCSRCLSELYYAAFDPTSGAIVTPERRLTNHPSDYAAGSTRAVWGPAPREIGVTWTDSRGSREVHAAIVSPDGVMRAEQVVSAAPDPQRGNTPSIVWNDDAWQLLYRHDDPSGSRPDYLHTRSLDVSGTLGADLDLRVPAEQIALTARGSFGYATVTTGGSALALRLWDLGWMATTTLPSMASTFDGSRGLVWDGADIFVTSTGTTFEVIRLNGLGTETGRIPLTSDSRTRSASNIRMHRLGTRLILMWEWSTGGLSPVFHHQVQVVETTSAM